MKHIREWEIDGLEASSLTLYRDEKNISVCKFSNGFYSVLASLDYDYTSEGTLKIESHDDYVWKLDADFDREVLTLDFKDEKLNKLLK